MILIECNLNISTKLIAQFCVYENDKSQHSKRYFEERERELD